MTPEYCTRCPFFMQEKGWLEDDDPFWAEHPDAECMCKTCPRREKCEAEGPVQDIFICFEENKGYLDRKVAESLKEK